MHAEMGNIHMTSHPKIGVIGAGSWGTALAHILAAESCQNTPRETEP